MEARAAGAVPRFVGFLYTLAKLVPVERFTGRRWIGAECLSSANSSFEGMRALRPRGLLRQPAGDGSILREITVPVTFCPTPTGKR
jgi:hypothetical protein